MRRRAVANESALSIGALAAACRLSVDTLRYYERQGLLRPVARTSGGLRRFDSTSVDRLRFIKQAQSQGLTLREIRELVSYQQLGGKDRCRRVHDLIERKLTELDARRRELDGFCSALRRYLVMCERTVARATDTADCPVVEDLARSRSVRSPRE